MDVSERGDNNFPNLKDSWTLCGMFLLFYFVFALLVLVLDKIFSITSGIKEWINLLTYIFAFTATLIYAKSISYNPNFDYGIQTRKTPAWLFVALLIITPAMCIVLNQLVSFIPMPESVQKMFAEMVTLSVPSFLTVVIAAPILEELLCRGIILRGLLKNIPPYQAIAWSSLIFAVMHLNPWQGITAFTIGFVSGWIYWKTKSIIPSIFIHFVNNGFAFIMLFLASDPSQDMSELIGSSYIVVLLIAIVILFSGLYFLYKKLEPNTTK